ncbi:MAG: hypothetical protein HUK25_04470 [Treponema sp.]|nr:hypothetical protein [Treponema sp.]
MKKIFFILISVFSCSLFAEGFPVVYSFTDKYGVNWEYSFEDPYIVKKTITRKSGEKEIIAGTYEGNPFTDGELIIDIGLSKSSVYVRSGCFQGAGYYFDHYYLKKGKSLSNPVSKFVCISDETVYSYSFYDGGLVLKEEIFKEKKISAMGQYNGDITQDEIIEIKILGEPFQAKIKSGTFLTSDYKLFRSQKSKINSEFSRTNKKNTKFWIYTFYEGGYFEYTIQDLKKNKTKRSYGLWTGSTENYNTIKVDHYLTPDFSSVIKNNSFSDRFGYKFFLSSTRSFIQ